MGIEIKQTSVVVVYLGKKYIKKFNEYKLNEQIVTRKVFNICLHDLFFLDVEEDIDKFISYLRDKEQTLFSFKWSTYHIWSVWSGVMRYKKFEVPVLGWSFIEEKPPLVWYTNFRAFQYGNITITYDVIKEYYKINRDLSKPKIWGVNHDILVKALEPWFSWYDEEFTLGKPTNQIAATYIRKYLGKDIFNEYIGSEKIH